MFLVFIPKTKIKILKLVFFYENISIVWHRALEAYYLIKVEFDCIMENTIKNS